jgi:hypothetical protein
LRNSRRNQRHYQHKHKQARYPHLHYDVLLDWLEGGAARNTIGKPFYRSSPQVRGWRGDGVLYSG